MELGASLTFNQWVSLKTRPTSLGDTKNFPKAVDTAALERQASATERDAAAKEFIEKVKESGFKEITNEPTPGA